MFLGGGTCLHWVSWCPSPLILCPIGIVFGGCGICGGVEVHLQSYWHLQYQLYYLDLRKGGGGTHLRLILGVPSLLFHSRRGRALEVQGTYGGIWLLRHRFNCHLELFIIYLSRVPSVSANYLPTAPSVLFMLFCSNLNITTIYVSWGRSVWLTTSPQPSIELLHLPSIDYLN